MGKVQAVAQSLAICFTASAIADDIPGLAKTSGVVRQGLTRQEFVQLNEVRASATNRLDCSYGRKVGVVVIDGHDVNLEQVRSGMAWWYRQYAKEPTLDDRLLYELAVNDVRAATRGLWADPYPVPPRESRRSGKWRPSSIGNQPPKPVDSDLPSLDDPAQNMRTGWCLFCPVLLNRYIETELKRSQLKSGAYVYQRTILVPMMEKHAGLADHFCGARGSV